MRLLSVNVGLPGVIGEIKGTAVFSGIAKEPVSGTTVFVGTTNIAGDAQADLSVHGGADKAVYCYSADHWSWWEREKAFPCKPAAFGENLTVEQADESTVAIGDLFRWGDVLLEVSQPRAPCFKFAIRARRPDAPSIMTASGRCGWYLRVLVEGVAPTTGRIEHIAKSGGVCVRDTFFAALDPRASNDVRLRVAAEPALAENWRRQVISRAAGR